MATTNYTGYTSSKEPATVTTLPAPIVEAQKMGTVTPIKVPTPSPYDTSKYTSTINSVTGSVQAQADALMREQEAQQKLAQAQGVSGDIATLTSQMGGKSADTANLYQNTGVNTAFKQLQDINAQATGLRNEAQAIPIANRLQAQKLGVAGTESQVQNVNYDQLQQNALKALSLGQQAAIAQADFNTAKNLADQQIDMKYEQLNADLKAKQLQLASLEKYELSPAQEKAKEALARQYKKEDEENAMKLADEKLATEMIINARGQGVPQEIADKAQKMLEQGGSKLDVARALGVYGGDYLRNELLKEQLKQARVKTSTISSEGRELVTENGVQLVKVTPKEIQDLNDTQTAKNSLVSLVDNMISSIDKYGTQVLYGKEAGTRSGAKTNLLLAMKNLEKTGALDKGTIDVLSGTIPESEFFATEAAQKAALQQLRDTVVNKTDEYIGSYRGTTAETDPRTKRIYEKTGASSIVIPQGVSTAGASYAQSTMNIVGDVNNQVNTQQSYSGYDTGIK